MRRLLAGLNVQDATWAALDMKTIAHAAHQNHDKIPAPPQSPEPTWVDWDQVERGQKLWKDNVGTAFVALSAALLQVTMWSIPPSFPPPSYPVARALTHR